MKTWACQGERLDICRGCSNEPARNYLVQIGSSAQPYHLQLEDFSSVLSFKFVRSLPHQHHHLIIIVLTNDQVLTSCLLPPTLRMTGPLLILLAMIRNGDGGWTGPSIVWPFTSSSTIWPRKIIFFFAKLRIFLFCWFCWIDYNDAHPLMFQHAVCSESFEEKNESIDKEKNEQKTFRMLLKYVCDDVVSMMHYT